MYLEKGRQKSSLPKRAQELGVPLDSEVYGLATTCSTPWNIHQLLSQKGYEPEKVLHHPEDAVRSKNLHCFDGAALGFTLGLLNSLNVGILYLEAISDEDHAIVVFEEGKKFGAFSQSSEPSLVWRNAEFLTIADLATSFRCDLDVNGPYEVIGYSERITEDGIRRNYGFDWITSIDSYRRFLHVYSNKLKWYYLDGIGKKGKKHHEHPLIIALQNGWIELTNGEYIVNVHRLPERAQQFFTSLGGGNNTQTVREINRQFFLLTGTTPDDLKSMTSYLNGWFGGDGFRIGDLF